MLGDSDQSLRRGRNVIVTYTHSLQFHDLRREEGSREVLKDIVAYVTPANPGKATVVKNRKPAAAEEAVL